MLRFYEPSHFASFVASRETVSLSAPNTSREGAKSAKSGVRSTTNVSLQRCARPHHVMPGAKFSEVLGLHCISRPHPYHTFRQGRATPAGPLSVEIRGYAHSSPGIEN